MRRFLVLGCAAFAALFTPAAAQAATIVVDTTGPGTPTSCSLASAIEAANTDAAVADCTAGGALMDRIEFALPTPATITLGAELPPISDDVEIAGPGAGALTISGDHSFRVLRVANTFIWVKVSGLTIADGRAAAGAGILSEAWKLELFGLVLRGNEAVASGGANPEAAGGAISVSPTRELRIEDSVIAGNTARALNGAATSVARGGGIEGGELTLKRSSVRENRAVAAGAPETTAAGGGIASGASLAVVDSTISDNEAGATAGASSNNASGGGIDVTGILIFDNAIVRSTIAANSVAAASPVGTAVGGGLSTFDGEPRIHSSTFAYNSAPRGANLVLAKLVPITNTIIAEPRGGGQSCTGLASLSEGWNLDEDGSCHLDAPSDRAGVDPLLAPGLADNGGPTETIALLHGSPAIDQGRSSRPPLARRSTYEQEFGEETTDQRGRRRPVEIPSVPNSANGNGADIGAFEVQVPRATITSGPEGPAPVAQHPSFAFVADEAGAGFLCSLDGGAATPCTSPYVAPQLTAGEHTLRVAAVGVAGYAQEPPASRQFTIAASAPPPVAKAPQTKLSALPKRTTKRRLTIRFSANQAGSHFSCKLDGKKWRGCSSPYTTPRLALGKHTFRVKATGPSGVVDPTPVKQTFRVVAPRRG